MANNPSKHDFEDLDDELEEAIPPVRSSKPKTAKPAKAPAEEDINFDFDDEEPSISHHQNQRTTHAVDDLDDLDDSFPEPPPVHVKSHKPGSSQNYDEEEFSDLDEEAPPEHSAHTHEESHEEEQDVENHEYEEASEEEAEQPKKKSMAGNAIMYGGFAVLAAIGAYFGYNTLFGGSSAPVTTATPPAVVATNTNTAPPRLPPATNTDVRPSVANAQVANNAPQLPPATNNTVAPRLPPMPNSNGINTNALPVQQPVATKPADAIVPALPTNMVSPNTPSTVPQLPVTPAPTIPSANNSSAPSSSEMSQLLDSFRTINDQIEIVRKRGDDIAANLKRLPQIESKIEQVDGKVDSIANRTNGLEERITALEQTRNNGAAQNLTGGGINPRANENRTMPTLANYHLVGVSQTSVLMTVPPNGQTQLVNLHEMIPGVGIAENLVWDANTRRWVLITSGGSVIR